MKIMLLKFILNYKSPSIIEFRSINEYKNKKLKKIKDENKFFKLLDKNMVKRNGSYIIIIFKIKINLQKEVLIKMRKKYIY